jgi:hypothetical protein
MLSTATKREMTKAKKWIEDAQVAIVRSVRCGRRQRLEDFAAGGAIQQAGIPWAERAVLYVVVGERVKPFRSAVACQPGVPEELPAVRAAAPSHTRHCHFDRE